MLLSGGVLALIDAQETSPLLVQDVLGARTLTQYSPIEFSPDGKKVAYTVRVNPKRDGEGSESVPADAFGADIYFVETTSGASFSVTKGQGSNWLPSWSPDGHYLAFLSDRDGSRQVKLWLWEASSGKLRKVSEASVQAKRIQWLPTGDEVLLSVVPSTKPAEKLKPPLSDSGKIEKYDGGASNSTVVTYRFSPLLRSDSKSQSAPWSLASALCDLAIVNIHNGNLRRIDVGHRISAYFLSPNGSEVAYTSPDVFEKPGSQQILFNVVVLSLTGGLPRTVALGVRMGLGGTAVSWSPDGSFVAFRTGGVEANGDCYVVDPKLGTSKNVTSFTSKHAGFSSFAPSWDTEGKHLFFTDGTTLWMAAPDSTEAVHITQISGRRIIRLAENRPGVLWFPGGSRSIVALTFDNESKEFEFFRFDQANHQATGLLKIHQCRMCGAFGESFDAVSGDGQQLVYVSQDAGHDSDLWLTNAAFIPPRRLTHINPQYDNHAMGTARLVEWRSLDGDLLRGALLLPAGYHEGKRYPLIVWVYGGELGSDFIDYFGLAGPGPFNLQLFATRGYAVFFPDAPEHLGTPMLDLAKAVLPGVDKVVQMGIADPERLGVLGHSNGGYSVLSLIVQTKRFKAAIECSGTADLMGMYGEMDSSGAAFGTGWTEGPGQMGGTPWEFREKYIENSPVFFLDRVETPLLIVHGANDTAVASFLGDEIFVGLRRLGKEVEYAKYRGEDHSPPYWSFANQVNLSDRMIDWFSERLR